MKVIAITSFPHFVEIINSDQVTFINFGGDWCTQCKQIKPVYERLSDDHGAVAKFYSVNIAQIEGIVEENRLTTIPTFMAFKNGSPIGTVTGSELALFSAFIAKHAPVN